MTVKPFDLDYCHLWIGDKIQCDRLLTVAWSFTRTELTAVGEFEILGEVPELEIVATVVFDDDV